MNVRTAWLKGLIGLAVVVGLPVAAHWAHHKPEAGCALDGAAIDPRYRVEIVDDQGQMHAFCCPVCARIWLRRQTTPPRTISVTDEASGERVEAAAACYVSSSVVTVPATGNRVHVFRSRAAAEKHAAAYGGAVLAESQRPFQ